MEAKQILKADLLDLVFEGRNKAYGAYQLRRNYHQHIYKAISVMLGAVALLIVIQRIWPKEQMGEVIIDPTTDTVRLIQVTIDKAPVPPSAQPPAIKPPALTPPPVENFVIVPDHLAIDPPPADPGPAPDDNIVRSYGNNPGSGGEPGVGGEPQGTAPAPTAEPPAEDNSIHMDVQKQAAFPGGANAWRRYLESRLNANLPIDNGAPAGTYTVVVSFIVNKEGQISDVQLVQPQGFGMSEEAIRVIARGPKWEPAEQNGRKVIYRQRQAITFRVRDTE